MSDVARMTTTPAWVWGGGLLLASAVVPLVLGAPGLTGGPGIANTLFAWVAMSAFSAALVIFAFGLGGRGSVVARRPWGVAAMVALAAVGPVMWVVTGILPSSDGDPQRYLILGYIDLAVRFAAALATVVAIGRARAVPPPWNWSPAWGLAALVVVNVITQVVGVALGSAPESQEALFALFGMSSLVSVAVPSLLGILAIVLGSRAEPRGAVVVYPPQA